MLRNIINSVGYVKLISSVNVLETITIYLCRVELNALIQNVENAILQMGLSKEESQADEQGQWILLKDETPIYIDAWEDNQSTPWNYFIFEKDRTVFQITVPFCYGPTLKRAEFLEELLVVNLNLHLGKFSYNTRDNVVVLSYRVPGSAFVLNSLAPTIDALAYYAEMAYHVLKDEFNLKRVVEGN